MKLLDVVHPAARTLTDIAKSQDSEVGDGTTSVVMLACSFMKEAKPYIEEGVHPQIIIRAYRQAAAFALAQINELSVKIDKGDKAELRSLLERCAATTLSSKLVAAQKGCVSACPLPLISSVFLALQT
jgi:T-complex protein 1 subunit eta